MVRLSDRICPKAVKTETQTQDNTQKYYLALSTDTLCTLSNNSLKWEILETICQGTDKDAIICECDDLNEYLDSLNIIQNCIKSNNNPLELEGFIY